MWIKLILLGAVAIAIILFVRIEHTLKIQAGKRVAFLLFILLNAYAVISPESVSWLANRLGVGRGADLVLYALVVAFVFVSLSLYMRIRLAERRLTELARSIAIRDAELADSRPRSQAQQIDAVRDGESRPVPSLGEQTAGTVGP